jgi:hypothetical protein
MIESPDKALFYVVCAAQTLVCVAAVGLIIVTVIFLLIVLKGWKKSGKAFCGRCGEPLSESPTSAIALTDKVFLAYECSACKSATLLPKDP